MANRITTAINALDQASGLVSGALPQTVTRLSYGFTLHTSNNGRSPRQLGGLQTAHFSQSRRVDDEFEVEANSTGLPIDQVTQILSRREINFQRFDLYSAVLESIFGTPDFITLLDTDKPLTIREVWKDPSGLLSTTTRAYQYSNIVITDYDRDVRVDNRIVVTNMTVRWNGKTQLL